VQLVLAMLTRDSLKIDCAKAEKVICSFIAEYLKASQCSGLVLGLSGGLDSSVAAALASISTGRENLMVFFISTDEFNSRRNLTDAKSVAALFDIDLRVVDISRALKVLEESLPTFVFDDALALGNLKTRVRMSVLYYYANRLKRLVLGTGDKSELLLGYFTKYGDGGVDLLPLGSLYKSQVAQLAGHLNIPESIVKKPPSPDLWPGQTAQAELGLDYYNIDFILFGLERRMSERKIALETGLSIDQVTRIVERISKNKHKRLLPPMPTI
jgi:NAD+ synthase